MASPLRDGGSVREEEVGRPRQQQQQGQKFAEATDDPLNGLDKTLALLAAKDDTSRFVGLALLKSILENKIEFQNDPRIVTKCWEAIPSKFLDRLLRACVKNEKSTDETLSLLELAVAVLHAFTILLPEHVKHSEKLVDKVPILLDVLSKRYVSSSHCWGWEI